MIIVIICNMVNGKKLSVKASNNPLVESVSTEFVVGARNLSLVATKVTSSEALFAGARELIIAHAGEAYRLRLTNQGKLILTK